MEKICTRLKPDGMINKFQLEENNNLRARRRKQTEQQIFCHRFEQYISAVFFMCFVMRSFVDRLFVYQMFGIIWWTLFWACIHKENCVIRQTDSQSQDVCYFVAKFRLPIFARIKASHREISANNLMQVWRNDTCPTRRNCGIHWCAKFFHTKLLPVEWKHIISIQLKRN